MSAKTIAMYQARNPELRPRPAVRLRNEASKIRAKAQSLLAQANLLDEMADELDGEPRE